MILKLITDCITSLFLLRISVCSCTIRLPSYINATQSVLETFKMARYFSHTYTHIYGHADTQLQIHLYTRTYMSITFFEKQDSEIWLLQIRIYELSWHWHFFLFHWYYFPHLLLPICKLLHLPQLGYGSRISYQGQKKWLFVKKKKNEPPTITSSHWSERENLE